MAFLFADSFDPYAKFADMMSRWDTVSPGTNDVLSMSTQTAFRTGQAIILYTGNAGSYVKNWGSNEATLFFSVRFLVSSPGAATVYASLQFTDAGTAQTTVRFNADGSIGLYAGGPTGTLLATIPTGVFALASWHSLQGKIVISNTAGSIELRANGATADTYSWTNVNTRGGTTNAYVNGVKIGTSSSGASYAGFDDVFLCSGSGAAPNSWPGDLRAMQQTAAGAVQTQFTPSAATVFVQGSSSTTASWFTGNIAWFSSVTCTASGTLASLSINLGVAATGHAMMAVYDSLGANGGPGGLLAASAEVVNPALGVNTFAITAGPTVTKGSVYWVGVLSDAASLNIYGSSGARIISLSTSYAGGFPAFAAGFTSSNNLPGLNSAGMTIIPFNASHVSDATGDSDATYVSSATVGQQDIYTLSPVLPNYAVVAVNYFAMWKRLDTGPRTVALSVAANNSPDTTILTNSALANSYVYSQTLLTLDPTGAAWTPTTVNAAKVGIKITA